MKYILLLLFISCAKDPVSTNSTNNKNIKVDFLFENEGCKVYRFKDSGNIHYYTNCTSTISTQRYLCGKAICSRPKEISTGHN